MQKSTVVVLSSILLAFALVGLLLPAGVVVARADDPCIVQWIVPTGTIQQGSLVTATIITSCKGQGDFLLTSQPSGKLVAKGIFHCPKGGCAAPGTTFFSSSTLAKGGYQLTADFNGKRHAFSFVVAEFMIVPEFPLAILGAVVPFTAFGVYALRRRRF